MRTSRAMRVLLLCEDGLALNGTPREGRSGADLLADQAADLAAVRGALRLAHHVAYDLADRAPAAGPDGLDRVRVRVDRRADDPLELVAVAHGAEALRLDDAGRVASLGDERVEHGAGRGGRDLLERDHPDERRERLGRDLR